MDSLALIELICSAEEEFDIEITDEEAASVLTLQDMLNLLKKKGIQASE